MVHSTDILRYKYQLPEFPLLQLHVLVQAVLTLSDEAERSRPFASPMGQLMVTQRTSQAAAKQVHNYDSLIRAFTLSLTHPLNHTLFQLLAGSFAHSPTRSLAFSGFHFPTELRE